MKTPQIQPTQPWSGNDLEDMQSRLTQSKRMLDAFPESLAAPSLLRKLPDKGSRKVEALPLFGIVTIGREGDPPFCFLDPTDSLSRRHFRILVGKDGACYAEDLQSKNGLRINGRQVMQRRLVHGDLIHAGNQDFVFHDGKPLNFDPLEL